MAKTVLVVGAGYAGLSVAHYTLKHIIPALPNKGEGYSLTLVDPSDSFFARPAAPRAVVSDKLLPTEKCFMEFQSHFKQYGPGKFIFIKGKATALDYAARTITVAKSNGDNESVPYYALVIACGTLSQSPLLGLHRDDEFVKDSWKAFQAAIPKAKSIVIAGGGPAGIETAGELGDFLNGKVGLFQSKLQNPKCPITVVCADSKILPALRPAIAAQAEKYLAKVGVTILKNVRVESVTPEGAGQEDSSSGDLSKVTQATKVKLSNGETLDADIYLPAMGLKPNAAWVPPELRTEAGYVEANSTTLRVDKAGPRVYVIGDVGSYSRGGIMDLLYSAFPVLAANVKRDLLHFAAVGDAADDGAAAEKAALPGKDREYKENLKETQLVPIGRSMGVGAVFGWRLPSFMVWVIKGRDYMLSFAPPVVNGSNWTKEIK